MPGVLVDCYNVFQFTIKMIGESGLGKTTFINTLFTTTIKAKKNPTKRHAKQMDKTVEIEITKAGMLLIPRRFGGCISTNSSVVLVICVR
jgi:hypothetical protein